MMVEMAASNTLIQSMIPNRLRGRVMSVYSMMFMGMAPVGALVAGALAAPLGAPATVALGGAVPRAGLYSAPACRACADPRANSSSRNNWPPDRRPRRLRRCRNNDV
jgi:MFS family permease